MHLRLLTILTLVWQAITMSARRPRAFTDEQEHCRSCMECSHDNGCVRCPERLFLFLRRDGMSHHGSCVHACPPGHYGQRGQDISRCLKCRSADCESCFSRDFCMRCRPGLRLFRGQCSSSCPAGTLPTLTDCVEGCLGVPEGPWGGWSTCLREGHSCGFRWGRQSRTRGMSLSQPEQTSALCHPESETRRCRMKKRCPTERRKKERGGGRKRGRKQTQQLLNETGTEPPGGT
ncbi:R-spondin-4 isoform X1 [Hypomesus transpacificus]|uniref:R-spondin-4 isoform X1 n=1 Tax=Hypomesus transpacificus TaxID=137520 RepID=UPI001F07B06C|nr:R-spondin-4 isoform X1 [Hypomesus transpacificus]